jgi:hypothetical protein
MVTFLERVDRTESFNVIGDYIPKQLQDVTQIFQILLPERKNASIRNTFDYAVTTEDPILL